jgi:hypothetical protein
MVLKVVDFILFGADIMPVFGSKTIGRDEIALYLDWREMPIFCQRQEECAALPC